MAESVRSVFDDECSKLDIGIPLMKRLRKYQQSFVNKNDDHIAFFGGNLIGVNPVKFMPSDHDRWFSEILEIDEVPVGERLIALKDINEEHVVSSDTMNLSCAWLVNAIYRSTKLNPKQKHEAMVDVLLVLNYKFLTSRLYRHFPYPADRAVAEATYAQLSRKYAIKRLGNWSNVLIDRAEEIISKDSIHYNAVTVMNSDLEVVYLLNDTQGRIRDMLKNIYGVFKNIHAQGIRITSTSSIVEHDGVEILKDKTKSLLAYGRYMNSIVTDKNSFVREELMTVIEKLMYTMPAKLFRESLNWMSDNYRQSGAGEIEIALNETLVHSFEYLNSHRDLIRSERDLPAILTRLRGVYMSSRSTDDSLFVLRNNVESIVKKATGNKNESTIASVRTGVLLYICGRAYTMRHYMAGGV